jgi:microcystin-dependent protein
LIRNFVVENANAPGTNVNVLLAGANPGYQTWRQAYPIDGSLVYYFIDDGGAAEWGRGTLHTATNPATLSRDEVIGNTGGGTGRVNFLGAVQVYNEIPGERMPFIVNGFINCPNAALDPHAGGVPVGACMDYWGFAPPQGWLFCDGRALSRTTYAILFSVIGTAYGAIDANTFLLPDTQGSTTYGFNQPQPPFSSGANQGRLGPWANSTMGTLIGDWRLDTHTHTLNWTDSGHAHFLSDPGHAHFPADDGHAHSYQGVQFIQGGQAFQAGIGFAPQSVTQSTTVNKADTGIFANTTGIAIFPSTTGIVASIANAGSGIGFQNVSPGIVCNKIIYCGPVP